LACSVARRRPARSAVCSVASAATAAASLAAVSSCSLALASTSCPSSSPTCVKFPATLQPRVTWCKERRRRFETAPNHPTQWCEEETTHLSSELLRARGMCHLSLCQLSLQLAHLHVRKKPPTQTDSQSTSETRQANNVQTRATRPPYGFTSCRVCRRRERSRNRARLFTRGKQRAHIVSRLALLAPPTQHDAVQFPTEMLAGRAEDIGDQERKGSSRAHLGEELRRLFVERRLGLRQLPLQLTHGAVQLQPQPVACRLQAHHTSLQPPHLPS